MILALIGAVSEGPSATAPADAGELWSSALVRGVSEFGIAVIVLCMLACIWRLLRGPHLADRALAVDNFAICLIALVMLMTFRLNSLIYVDGVLVLSLLGFAGAVAMAQFIARRGLRARREA